MTGEVTLTGNVLEIGGLKEKLLAALRGQVKIVLIPKSNLKDLEEMPKEVTENIQIKAIDKEMNEMWSRGSLVKVDIEEAKRNNRKPFKSKFVFKVKNEPDGSISNVVVERGVSDDLDREAKRVVRSMPRWKAGKNNGKAVRARCRLPIAFNLQ
jgi:hypothetical protein